MPSQRLSLVVGLGNPGDAYAQTRHNAGFMVAEELAAKFDINFDKRKFDTVFGRGHIEQEPVVLAKPIAFMNRSGLPVKMLADFFKISSEAVLVIHDDIDLAFGRLKIKEKGGHGGHNGVRSLIDAFGRDDFVRLRIGVGRSGFDISVSDHVLSKFTGQEKESLDQIIATARDAVVTILCKGTKAGMNQFNQKLS
ncbi:MAG: aminoacyl-tRNA hydrolase [Deltaproteobacteria bacterium]|jgi:PTH1 family peptidyl-tRNA hydrolase|nr:aminoacyl-tRNA hydrolase [Deltaproteobacteria bacterium]